ncbi:MAG: DUF2939 domain-containing protein [Candidatus Andeanibacterium colombiense]|uniref:DUF2939 domain-containing protein n=1 Tax=Candidatus Andeanibacterium colombiense TaxID=3121345 RepID=A0AAJ6BPW2_9SPHN|nr:MAG: DUF2939 domain-containing protein [Sphingomonadaceae bacterium]
MRRLVIVLGVIVLVALAGWQAMSPWMALDTLRDAAREGDTVTLEQNIDFPALRESAKSELYQQVQAEARKHDANDPLAGLLGSELAKRFISGTVDALVTPGGVSAMLITGKALPGDKDADTQPEIDWHVKWVGPRTFRAVPETKDGKAHPSLIFKRAGLSWKLAGIDIP